MHPEQERGDDAEVAAAAANRPEQIGVLLGIGGHEPAVGQHDVDLEDVVDGQAAAAGEMAEPAAERQAADAGGRDDAGRHGIAERVRGVIDIAPCAAAFDAHGLRHRVDANTLHPRQLDHQAVVDAAEAAGVVTAALDGEQHLLLACEVHGGDDVGDISHARDEARLLVDHRVVDLAGFLVTGVGRLDQFAAQTGLERGDGGIGRHARSPGCVLEKDDVV